MSEVDRTECAGRGEADGLVLVWNDGSERMRAAVARADAAGREVVLVGWITTAGASDRSALAVP